MTDHEVHLFCHKCGCQLHPGSGNFYVVRIEAFADPTPPDMQEEEIETIDVDEEIGRIIEQMKDMSSRELMDQVHRRVTIHLCARCYAQWIEDPAK